MKKNRLFVILTIVSLVVGIALLFYPATSNVIFVSQQNKIIDNYNQQIEQLEANEVERLRQEAEDYNESLSNAAASAYDGVVVSGNLSYSQLLSIENEQMGYIVVPKIKLNQPIYHSTTEEVLERGIGHMENTSLPIGGESTHCVLTGHSAVPGMMLFTDLEDVVIGDKFYIKTLNEVLAYEIDQIKVVLPNDASDLQIVEGEDYVTLLTCTPYAINTHRLLVRGTRVPYNGEIDEPEINSANENDKNTTATVDETVSNNKQSKYSFKFILYYVIIPTIISLHLVFLVIVIFKVRKKRRENKHMKSVNKSDET